MSEAPAIKDTLGAFVPGGDVRLAGDEAGPLKGVSFAAKDIFDIAGHVTGCGNPDWARSHPPAEATAPAVRALLDAGADLMGKTITDELAYSLNGQNFHYGTPTNTNAPGRIPGGSSSGSAAAVAGGLVDLALGSDTGGSIRIPGSYCGNFGLRPSHGRISLDRVMPLAPSFDTAGWFARDAGLLRRVGEVLLGEAAAAAAPGRLLLAEDAFELADAPARAALAPLVARLEARMGPADRVRIGDPGGGLMEWMWRFRKIQAREIWAIHGPWIETTEPRFGPEIEERFQWAKGVPEAEAETARQDREAFTARIDALLEGAVICLPTAPGISPFSNTSGDSLRNHRNRVLSLTCPAGLARLPQVTLPLATVEGCPVGLSLMGARGSDMTLLAFAEEFAADPGEA